MIFPLPTLICFIYGNDMDFVALSADELREVHFDPAVLPQIIAFVENEQRRIGTGGMQLAMFKNNRLVLSVWSGRDNFADQAIKRTTLFPLLSATKGLASLALLHLHHLGCFKWNDTISQYWPGFGAHGKGDATIEHLLSHRLGLPSLTAEWRHWPDRAYMTGLVERAIPEWRPGSRYGYHGGSWGIIVDELVRRWTGQETGEILRESLAVPRGIENCFIGLPRERYPDVARLAFIEPEQRRTNQWLSPFGPDGEHNSPVLLASCQSSGGGVASAEDMARLYNLAAFEGTIGSQAWLASDQRAAARPRNDPHHDAPAARPELRFTWGLGFMVNPSSEVFGNISPEKQVLGHPGASGALGYAMPENRIAVAFTINGVGGRNLYRRFQIISNLVKSGLGTVAVKPLASSSGLCSHRADRLGGGRGHRLGAWRHRGSRL